MSLARAVVISGAALLVNACAAGPTALSETPAAHDTPSAKSTVTPTPVLPLEITGVAFHGAEMGFGYVPVTPTAKGGVLPYMWQVTSGNLPPGLIMDPTGKVTNTEQPLPNSLSIQAAPPCSSANPRTSAKPRQMPPA